MSKKKNKKFKKAHSHNFVRPSLGISLPVSESTENTASRDEVEEIKVTEPIKLNPYDELDQKYVGVRHEVRKILAIMSILILVLAGVYTLKIKTSVLDQFGSYLYRVANIQAQ